MSNTQKKINRLFILLILLISIPSFASNRYWVGDNSNKNWNATANWSSTSGGSGGASVPVNADNVYFDGNGNGQCIFNVAVSALRITIDSTYTDTIKQNGNTLTVGLGGLIQNGGVFWGNTSNINLSLFTLNKGTFRSTANRLSVSGNYTINSPGVFLHNNGETFFTGVFTIKGAVTLYDCRFYPLTGVGGTYTLDPSANITIEHLLTHSGPIINGTGTINVKGDITMDGSTVCGGGTATITINGTGDQIFNGKANGSTGSINSIKIDKLSGTLFLKNQISVSGNWELAQGDLDATTYNSVLFFPCALLTGNGYNKVIGTQELNDIYFSTGGGYTNNFMVETGTVLTVRNFGCSGVGGLNILGDIHVTGNMDLSSTGFGGGTGTITIDGTGDQTIVGATTAGRSRLCNLTINKTGGTLRFKNYVSIGATFNYVTGNMDGVTDNPTLVFTRDSKTISGKPTLQNVLFLGDHLTAVTLTDTVTVDGDLTFGGNYLIGFVGVLRARGNITQSSVYEGFNASTGATLLIAGGANQTFTGAANNLRGWLYNIVINKTGNTLFLKNFINSGGNWTHLNGNIDGQTHNATVVFGFTSGGKTISGTHSLYNVMFYANNVSSFGIPASSELTVLGNLTFEGTYAMAMYTGTIQAKGNIFCNHTGVSGGGTTTISISGDQDQTFNGSASIGISKLPNVTINKIGGTLILKDFINVAGNWSWLNGAIDVSTHNSTVVFPISVSTGRTISGNHALKNVTFLGDLVNNSSINNIPAADVLTVTGELKFSGAYPQVINTGTIDAQGDINVTTTSYGNTGSFTLNVSGIYDQTWTGAGGPGQGYFNHVKINKTGGTLFLKNHISVIGNWSMISGNMDAKTFESNMYFNAGNRTISGNPTFYNVTFNAATYTSLNTIPAADVLTTEGTLHIQGGYGVALSTGSVNLKGNLTTTNTGVINGFDALINVCGTGNQTITGLNAAPGSSGRLGPIRIDKPSGTLFLANVICVQYSWTYVRGTVDAGTSTVVPVVQNVSCESANGHMSFYNYAPTNGVGTITLLTDLYVKNNITMGSGTTLSANGKTIYLGGNLATGSGVYTHANGTIVLNGTGSQTLSTLSSAYTLNLYNLTINKPSGKAYANPVIYFANNLSLVKGVLVAKTSSINLLDNATSTGGSNQSYVAGPFRKLGNDAFTYPLGDTTLPDTSAYHPFGISAPPATSDGYIAQYYAKNQLTDHPTFTSYASTLKPISTCEYWSLTRTAGATGIIPTAGWNSNTCNINALTDARVASWSGTQWTDLGNNSTTGNQAAGTIKANTAGPNTANQYYVLAELMPTPIANQRYWVGNGSNKSWNNTANWAAVSGGPGGNPVPTANDTVIFDGGGKGESDFDVNVSIAKLLVKSTYNTNAIVQGTYNLTVGAAGMTMNGGSFTGGSGTITNNGSLTLGGSNFTSTSANFTIYGSFTKTGGSFTHNNGRVILKIGTSISGSTNFYSLELNPTGDAVYTLNSSDVLNVAGELKYAGAPAIVINSGSIHAKGDVTLANTHMDNVGNYTLVLDGDGDQTINGADIKWRCVLNNVVITKTAGTVILKDFISVLGNWTNTNGTATNRSNPSTVVFNGGSKTISGNTTFKNLSFYSDGTTDGIYTIPSGNALTVEGEFRVEGNKPFFLNGNVNAQGNIVAFYGSTSIIDGGTGTITINGTGNQLFSGYDAPKGSRLCNIVIDKVSGTLTLDGSLTPEHNWTYINGAMDPGTSTIYFTNSGGRKTVSGKNKFNNVVFYGELYHNDTTTVVDTMSVAGELKYSQRVIPITGGTIAAKGNITIESDQDVNPGDYTLLITGVNNQLLKGNATQQARAALNNVVINKTGGTLSLKDKISVKGNWIYQQGNLDAKTNLSTLILRDGNRVFSGNHFLYNLTLLGYDVNDPSTSEIPEHDTITVEGEFKIDGGNGAYLNTGTINATGSIRSSSIATANTGGTATINICGELDQSLSGQYNGAGRFCNIKINKPSGTLNLSGNITVGTSNWNYVKGIVNPGTSRVVFWGNGTVNTANGASSMDFYHFEIQNGSVTMLSPIIARKDFKTSSFTTLTTNSHDIFVGGYFQNGGVFNVGTTTITFNGTGRQDEYTSTTTNYHKIVINKPSGNVFVDGVFVINNNLSLVKGALVPRSSSTGHYVRILDNATTTGGSNTSFIMCGVMKMGDDGFTFPMGDTTLADSAKYHPFTIPPPASSTSYTVRYFPKNPLVDYPTYTTIQSPLQSISTAEYYYVEAGPALTPTLSWNTNNSNVNALADIRIANWNGTQWTNLGNASTTGNLNKGTITAASASTSAYDKYFAIGNINDIHLDPVATFQNSGGTCVGKTITFANTSLHASSYQWKVNNANVSTATNLTYTFNTIGTYTITLVASNGTVTDTENSNFVVGNGLTVNAGTDKTIRSGVSVTLGSTPTASMGTAPFSYTWSPSIGLTSATVSNPNASPVVNTLYHVLVQDAQGCSGVDSVLVTVLPAFIVKLDTVSNVDSGYVKLQVENGTPPYTYHWNDKVYNGEDAIRAALDTVPVFDSLAITPTMKQTVSAMLNGSERWFLTPGPYLVMVTDSTNDTTYTHFIVSNKRDWVSTSNFSTNEKIISKTASNGWNNGELVSMNMVPNTRNNYAGIEFIVNNPAGTQVVGYRTQPASGSTVYDKIKYGLIVDQGIVKILENGNQITVGPYHDGDVLGVAMIDTTIVYTSDDSLLRITSVSSSSLDNYYLSVNVYNQSSSIEVKSVLGIRQEPRYDWTIQNALFEPKNSGGVDLMMDAPGIFGSYVYEWKNSSGAVVSTSEDLAAVPGGRYNLKLSYQGPFGAGELNHSFLIPTPISWSILLNVKEQNNMENYVIKTAEDGWNTLLQSENVLDLSKDGYLEFSAANNTEGSDVLYSLSASNSTSPSAVNYGIGVFKTGIGMDQVLLYYIMENGVIKKFAGAGVSDVFAIQYKHATNEILYLQNHQLLYTSQVSPTVPLHINGIIFKGGDVISLPSTIDIEPLPYNYMYVQLKDKLDGDYYQTKDGVLHLKYEEEYTTNSNKLTYKIYDHGNNVVVNSSSQETVVYKNNYYSFNLQTLGLTKNRYYILEVSNKKAEKKYLRFKY